MRVCGNCYLQSFPAQYPTRVIRDEKHIWNLTCSSFTAHKMLCPGNEWILWWTIWCGIIDVFPVFPLLHYYWWLFIVPMKIVFPPEEYYSWKLVWLIMLRDWRLIIIFFSKFKQTGSNSYSSILNVGPELHIYMTSNMDSLFILESCISRIAMSERRKSIPFIVII